RADSERSGQTEKAKAAISPAMAQTSKAVIQRPSNQIELKHKAFADTVLSTTHPIGFNGGRPSIKRNQRLRLLTRPTAHRYSFFDRSIRSRRVGGSSSERDAAP